MMLVLDDKTVLTNTGNYKREKYWFRLGLHGEKLSVVYNLPQYINIKYNRTLARQEIFKIFKTLNRININDDTTYYIKKIYVEWFCDNYKLLMYDNCYDPNETVRTISKINMLNDELHQDILYHIKRLTI